MNNIIDGDILVVYNAPIARRKLGLAGIPGSGNVIGPGSSTDNAIARFDGVTGDILKNGTPQIQNDGRVTNVTNPTAAQDAATKAYVDAAIAAVVGGIGAVMRGSGPPVAAPADVNAGAIYYDDDIASPSYDTAWHWSVPGQIWIGA